jgi:hypothetical protein
MSMIEDINKRLDKVSKRNYRKTETVAKAVHRELVDLTDKWNEDSRKWDIEHGFEPLDHLSIEKPVLFQDNGDWLIAWDFLDEWALQLDGCIWDDGRCMEAQYSSVVIFHK